MNIITSSTEKQVKAFCVQIGADPLLVQGAGGNISWKDGDVLWVKASGMWIADATSRDIFVPVNLSFLQKALSRNDFFVKPEVTNNCDLRPSIETLLHALMPHRVVVHIHAVEILAHLVQVNAKEKIKNLVGDALNWIYVEYFKPGSDLAKAVSLQLINTSGAEVVFLGNHGVVIGGQDVKDVAFTLRTLISKLKTIIAPPLTESRPSAREPEFLARGYIPCGDKEISFLVNKGEEMNRLRTNWALYPDHVVFLGAEPAILRTEFNLLDLDEIASLKPPFIFSIKKACSKTFTQRPRKNVSCAVTTM